MVSVTTATDTHVPGIVDLWVEFMDFHSDIDPRFPLKDNAAASFETHLKNLMAAEDTLVLVVLDRNRLVGYSTSQVMKSTPIWERETYGSIMTMVVTSDCRRKGFGERLLAQNLDWFRSRGIDRIELSVAAGNQAGYSFWRKHGFGEYAHQLYRPLK